MQRGPTGVANQRRSLDDSTFQGGDGSDSQGDEQKREREQDQEREGGEDTDANVSAQSTSQLLRYPLELPDQTSVEEMLAIVQAKNWVADIGVTPEQFRNRGQQKNSMRYIGAYVAGSAIGDGRLVSQQGDHVTFRAFDYRTDQYINLEMRKVEFVEAYARHILPARMNRVRFAGLFRSAGRPARLLKCRMLIAAVLSGDSDEDVLPQSLDSDDESQSDTDLELRDGMFCTQCQTKMESVAAFEGDVTLWMIKVSLLVVAWLTPFPSAFSYSL